MAKSTLTTSLPERVAIGFALLPLIVALVQTVAK